MHPVTSVKGNRNAANGDFKVSLNVRESTTSIVSSVLISPARMPPAAVVFGSRMRSMLNWTAAASSGVPSWNRRFARSLSTNVRSSVCSHDSTSPGASRPLRVHAKQGVVDRASGGPPLHVAGEVRVEGQRVGKDRRRQDTATPDGGGRVRATPARGVHRTPAAPAVVALKNPLLVSMIDGLPGGDGVCVGRPRS